MLFSRPLQAASAAASRTRRRTWLGSTALLASLAVTAAPSGAWAVCSGVDTGTVLCDAANPSGGSLDTTAVFLGSTVDINAGAGINTGVALGAAAVVTVAVGGDVTFNLTDPAGISSTVAGSSAIFLDSINAGPGRITYNGSSNVTSAATGIKILASGGGNVIRQSAGVVTGAANAIDVSQIDQWFVGFVTVDTVGSQINGNISVASNAAVTITTGAVAGGIHIEEYGFAGIGDILITTNGAINNLSGQAIVFNTRSFSPTTGSITLTANATVKGDIDLEQTHASATAPVTVTLNQGVTSNIIVSNAGSGATTVSTQGIDGSLTVESSGHLNTTVNGNINAVGGAAGAFGASITGPGDMNVAINGAVSATGTGVAVATAAGAFVNSAGISASGHTRIFNASGDVTAMATSTGAAGSATAIGAGASSNGSATLEATFSGAVSATAIASGTGATADATGVRTGVGNGGTGDVKLLLNGPVTATATAGNAGTASAVGIQALFMGGGSGNLNVTANDMVLANASDGPGQAIGILALDFNNVASTTAMTFIVNKDVSAAGSINAIGIAAAQGPSGLGGVSFDVMGSVTATASAGGAGGIQASIANAANPNTMAIRVGGDVIASGQAGLGFGIMASSAGIGDIVIDVMGAVRSTGVGISASRTAAGNIFINADSVTGTTGVATSGGTATVVIGSSVTGTDGIAVQLGGTSDILRLLGTSITGSVIGTGTSILQLGGTNSAKFDSSLGGFASVASFAGSNWTLNGNSSFAGPINVDGVLAVNGLIPNAAVVVGANGTLAGTGAVGNVTMNGGTLSPGNSPGTLTMTSLTMTAATTYLVQVQGAVSDRIVVTGNANIAGALIVTPLTRQVQRTTYTIASAGSLNGTFNSMVLTNNFARNAVLSYVGNDVLLTLDPSLLSPILPGAASTNQRNVAGAIDAALLGGSSMTDAFSAIFALSGNGLLNGLTQLSGETATGSQQTTFNAMNLFLNVMTDPFIAGRGDGANIPGAAPGFADEEALAYAARKRNPNDALAAIYAKAPPVAPFQQRWSVWAAGYGGSQTTDGNTVVGSNTTTSRVYGTAVGADYRFSPFTIAGFSLAGGGTNFSVANNGAGRSDLFQAGAFIRHNFGAAYLSGALAYGWQDITTDRTVTVAGIDRLRAQFNANAWSGRVESGYRFVAPVIGGIGFTPYAAGQFTTFELPAYAESVVSGANTFALAYGARSVTATRSELGLRTDRSFAMQSAILTLRGRLAWAHDFNPSRGIGATFQTLPGASFFVNGAAQASDSALVTASAETKWMNGWSTAATFEGEFSNVTRSYAGKGVVRYAW